MIAELTRKAEQTEEIPEAAASTKFRLVLNFEDFPAEEVSCYDLQSVHDAIGQARWREMTSYDLYVEHPLVLSGK